MSMFERIKGRAVEHLPAVAGFTDRKQAKNRLIVLAVMVFVAASFSVDLKTGAFNGVRCLLIFGAQVTGWWLWTKANRHGKFLTLVGAALAFVLSGAPSSLGGTNGEQAWTAMSAGTDILNSLLGDRLRAVGAVVAAWLRTLG